MAAMTSDDKAWMLLLPGYGYDERLWGRFADELSKRYRLAHVRYPGHGGSSMPSAPIDAVAAAEKTAEGLPGPSAVLAYGGGAAGAAWLARRGLAWALVLLSPNPGTRLPEAEVNYDEVLSERLGGYEWAPEVAAIADPEVRRREFGARLTGMVDGLSETDRVRLRQMFEDNADAVLAGDGTAVSRRTWLNYAAEINVPVLVTAPADDVGDRITTATAARLPQGQWVRLPATGNAMPWLVDPEGVARVVIEFLQTRGP
jgi:pimeloyl-ACP methyl ester carboxylesterase